MSGVPMPDRVWASHSVGGKLAGTLKTVASQPAASSICQNVGCHTHGHVPGHAINHHFYFFHLYFPSGFSMDGTTKSMKSMKKRHDLENDIFVLFMFFVVIFCGLNRVQR
jgi:hypothetical protein